MHNDTVQYLENKLQSRCVVASPPQPMVRVSRYNIRKAGAAFGRACFVVRAEACLWQASAHAVLLRCVSLWTVL